MHTGMLWFDNSTTTLTMKIKKALEYYYRKYGKVPDLVLVHPSMMEGENGKTLELKGVFQHFADPKDATLDRPSTPPTEVKYDMTCRPYRPVLPGHIWIGIEDKN